MIEYVGRIVVDCGVLDAQEVEELFHRLGVQLSFTTVYTPVANGKVECGHEQIVKPLVRACDRRIENWPRLLPYALWADQTTHSLVTGYMPVELMFGQKLIISVEQTISSLVAVD